MIFLTTAIKFIVVVKRKTDLSLDELPVTASQDAATTTPPMMYD